MNSIRVFLVVVILAVITLFLFLAALRGYQSSMLEAERLFDKQLLDTAHLIANIHTEQTARNIGSDASLAFQVWRGNRLVARSSNAPDKAIGPFMHGFNYANFGSYRWRTTAYLDRMSGNWILVADRADLRYVLAENVILESLLPTLMGLPVVGILIWLIVTGGLRPLRTLARELANRQADDLSPLAIAAPKKELAQIVTSSNGLLQRLETSLLRERQFASDAAHELRTPISALKLEVYNLVHDPGTDSRMARELEQTVDRLGHIVEQILDLYRSSPDRYNAKFERLELEELASETVAEMFEVFERKQQHIVLDGDRCMIDGDRFALRTLLQNLLSNANKYTPVEGHVLVELKRRGDRVLLVVEDSGPGIPKDKRSTIFERFYRIGRDRHPSGEPGCGLGLAIVKRLVELHRGTIKVGPSRFESGAAFTVSFPIASPGTQPGNTRRLDEKTAVPI